MRFSLIAGAICILLGGLVFFRLATYTNEHEVAHVGDVRLMDQEQRPVPFWVGICFTVAGVGLIVQGVRAKEAS